MAAWRASVDLLKCISSVNFGGCWFCNIYDVIHQGSARNTGLLSYIIGEQVLHSTQTSLRSFHADESLSSIFIVGLRQVDSI